MNNRLTLLDLAGKLAKQTGRTKKEMEEFLKEFISVVSEGVFTDKIAKIKGLGTFKIIEVEDRESINVNTGKRFVIPGHYKFTFTPDKELKELVNKPFSFFDTTEINNDVHFPEMESSVEKAEGEEEETIEIITPEPEIPEDLPEKIIEGLPVEEKQIKETVAEESVQSSAPLVIEEKITEPAPKEQLIREEKVIKTPPVNKKAKKIKPVKKSEKKKKSNFMLWAVIIILSLLMSAAGGYFFLMNSRPPSNTPPYTDEPQYLDMEETVVDIPSVITIEDEPEDVTDSIETEQPVAATQTAVTKPEDLDRIKIEPGSRLTLIAQKYYNHKIFWVYLYEYNKTRIANPNNIPIGTEILVPAPELYGIDSRDRTSIEKAIALQTEILSGDN